jgi:hypothetical protein
MFNLPNFNAVWTSEQNGLCFVEFKTHYEGKYQYVIVAVMGSYITRPLKI